MTPIKGKNVVLQFMGGSDYETFACALNCAIQINTDEISVKTINDGVWAQPRPRALSYNLSLTGLIVLDDANQSAFDLVNAQINMVQLQWRMYFQDPDNGLIKVMTGVCNVKDTEMGGTSEGFASSNFTMSGVGAPTISNSLTTLCDLVVTDLTADFHTVQVTYTGSDTLLRFEYSINGGARQVAYTNPFAVDPSIPPLTPTEVQVWPICDNGQDGTPFTKTLTFD